MNSFLIILIIITCLLLIWYVKRRTTVYSPANVFTLFWTLQILLIVLGGFNYLYFRYGGILYILSLIAIYDVAFVVSDHSIVVSNINKKVVSYRVNYCEKVFTILLLFYILSDLYGKISSGTSIGSFFNIGNLLELSNQNSVDKYENDGADVGVFGKLVNVNSFLVAILGGMMFHYYKGKKKMLTLIPVLFLVFNGLIAGSKMGIITGSFLWGIGYTLVIQMMKIPININFRVIIYSLLGIFAFVMILLLTMMFRIGQLDIDTFNIVVVKMISYAFGHLPAFDIWFVTYDHSAGELTLGGKILYGLTNPLGILERKQGVYDELLEVSPYGDATNVFTVFRFFVEDFGVWGSYIFMILIGSFSAIVYKNFTRMKNVFLSTTLMCLIYFFISWSFVTSVLAYTSYIATFVLLYFILKFIFRVRIIKL